MSSCKTGNLPLYAANASGVQPCASSSRRRQRSGERNKVESEHGRGNAVDLRAFVLADGRVVGLTDMTVAKEFRGELRESACHRFTTVLGPGSDGYHEAHIHLDLAERQHGYRMCQWDVREPPVTEVAVRVPLPTSRPAVAGAPINHERKL